MILLRCLIGGNRMFSLSQKLQQGVKTRQRIQGSIPLSLIFFFLFFFRRYAIVHSHLFYSRSVMDAEKPFFVFDECQQFQYSGRSTGATPYTWYSFVFTRKTKVKKKDPPPTVFSRRATLPPLKSVEIY